ncbi:hypothetical protein Nepgr_018378 [Nepenthes gracilis]|uniref:RecA family profile 2 domain-containing protein n=1 Tax=Nepenthes gracilis TaxID=150966 RepID=A0AAD3SST1_NEPGR|nr:hypothetical protein Nepgr_018378 [Nepenthes gracilis]
MVKIVKNKFSPPFRTAEFELEFGRGTSRESEVIDLSLKHNLLPKSPKFSRERHSQTFSARRRKRERGTYDETQRDYFRLTKLTKRMQRNFQKGNL